MNQKIVIGTLPEIEALQIYTAPQVDAFAGRWLERAIDYLRFERVTLPGSSADALAIDLVLRADGGQHSLIVIGVLVSDEAIRFPAACAALGAESVQFIADVIKRELAIPPGNFEIRPLHPAPRLPVREMTIERVLPGMRDYTTAVNHLKRYTFLLDHLLPGSVIECACGTGYGAAILARHPQLAGYTGIDLSPIATEAAAGNVVGDPRFEFRNIDLATPLGRQFENVISLETIEHTPNPYAFLELLVEKCADGGQVLLSLPTEPWGGYHLNKYHLSCWTRQRFLRFVEQYFRDVTVYTQRLSLLGPTPFEASSIAASYPDVNEDECFVAVLKSPMRQRRPNIVIKRRSAMGDVIWITPVVAALRRQFPEHNLIVVTAQTQVFMNNPDVDLVFSPHYEPLPDDLIVDLDLAYEQRRDLHLLHAYADASGVSVSDTAPRLFPTALHVQRIASALRQRFQPEGVTHLLAVHMAATSPDRIWPAASWQALLTTVLNEVPSLGIVALGSDNDFSLDKLGIHSPRTWCLVGKLDLLHTAAALAQCDLLVGPDSGLLHVAAAMQTPYIGLFGMADPATRLPLTGNNRALWPDIECRGCLRELPPQAAPRCRLGHAACMDQITEAGVRAEIYATLATILPDHWQTKAALALGQSLSEPTSSTRGNLDGAMSAYARSDRDEALRLLLLAIEDEPENPLVYAYLAFISADQGLADEAANFLAQAKTIAPTRHDLDAALGEAFLKAGNPQAAKTHLETAIRHQPDLFAAYPALAEALRQLGDTGHAIQLLSGAVAIASNAQDDIRVGLIELLTQRGDLAALAETCIRARGKPTIHSLGIRLLACAGAHPERVEEEQNWHAATFLSRPNAAAPSRRPTEERLTIAFLSSNQRAEGQKGRLEALLLYLPPERFSTVLIDNDPSSDGSEAAQRASLITDDWIRAHDLDDAQAVQAVAKLQPDLLIDLDGHGPRQRLVLFDAVPTAFKASWSNCPPGETSGIADLDALLRQYASGDARWLDADDFLALPEVDAAPASAADVATFGCLTPVIHVAEPTWRLYARLLASLPSATLKLNLDRLGDPARRFIVELFAEHGIAADRLEFIAAHDVDALCRAWRTTGVALIPPHTDGERAFVTALWMNKPTIVTAADTHSAPWAQRPARLLAALGYPDAIAADEAAWLAKATTWASASPRVDYRQALIEAGLTDPVRFARHFSEAIINAYYGTPS